MIDAATEFVKSGFDENQSAKLGEIAAMYTNIADTEVSTADAASFLISQMKAFNIEAENSEHIIDAVNETANKYAVGTNDLSTALVKAGTALGSTGTSFEETIGLVTAGTEILIGQPSKVGNGLRTIALNIADLAAESDKYVAANNKVNISLVDSQGNMRDTFEIMKDLYLGVEGQSAAWSELSEAEQVAIGSALAGKNQYNVFTSVMSNFEAAIGATETALNSQGSAAKENSKYMDSLEAKVAAIKSSFQELALNVINSDTVKSILDGVNKALEFLNTDAGAAITKFTLLTGAITGFTSIAGNVGSKLVGMFDAFANITGIVDDVVDAGKTVGGVSKTVASAASATASVGADVVSTVADVADAAGDVADAAGDATRNASKAASAASDVVGATANVADAVSDVGKKAGSGSKGVLGKLASGFGAISKFALPAAAAITGIGMAIGGMVKASNDANYTSKLESQLGDLQSDVTTIEGLIDDINGMTINPAVKEDLVQGLNDLLDDTKTKIGEINEKQIQWMFEGSELKNAQQKDNPNWNARGMSTSFSDISNWDKIKQDMIEASNELAQSQEGTLEDQVKAKEAYLEQYDAVLQLVEGLITAEEEGYEYSQTMQEAKEWLNTDEAKNVLGEKFNIDEMVYGAPDFESQISQYKEKLEPQIQAIGEAYESVFEQISDGSKMTATEAAEALEGLNEAFGEVEGFDYNKLYDSLKTGDIDAFRASLEELVEQQLLTAHGMENVANATEDMKEVWAQGLVDAGMFDDLESALEFIQGIIDEINETEINTDGSVDALNNQAEAAEDAGTETSEVAGANQEVNNNPVTDGSSGALQNQAGSATVAKDATELVIDANQGVNSNPVNTGTTQAQLDQAGAKAINAKAKLNEEEQAQASITNNPANTGATQSQLTAVETTAQRVAANVKSLWSGLVSFVSSAASKIKGFFSYAGPVNNVGPSSGAKAQGDNYIQKTGKYWVGEQGPEIVSVPKKPKPTQKRYSGSIDFDSNTEQYWVGENGPEVVTLPKGASVTSNKDIERATGIKVRKGDIKGGRAQGTPITGKNIADTLKPGVADSGSNKVIGAHAQGTTNIIYDIMQQLADKLWDGLNESSLRDYLEENIYKPLRENPPRADRNEFRDPGVETYANKINRLMKEANAGAEEALRIAEEENEALEKQLDLYEAQTDILDHKLFLMEKNGASEYEQIALLRQMQKEANDEANSLRKQGYSDESEYIRDLQKEWWDYEDQITDLYRDAFDERFEISENWIDKRNFYNDWGADSEIKAWERVLNWMQEWYEDDLIDYEYYLEKKEEVTENYVNALREAWEEEANALETAFDVIADKAQAQIDELERQQDEIEDEYDKKIEALEEQNDKLDEQVELEEKLDKLARAKQQKMLVYKDGRWQYVNDVDEVSNAQTELDEYEREKHLKEEIAALEESRDKEIEAINDKIEYWQKYVDEYGDAIDNYEKEQDRLLAEQILGISLEGENWEKRLGNLADYIERYKKLMEQINGEDYTPNEPGDFGLNRGDPNSAYLPTGEVVPVEIEDGKTLTQGLPVGTIVTTPAGGDWMITGVNEDGSYQSQKVPDYDNGRYEGTEYRAWYPDGTQTTIHIKNNETQEPALPIGTIVETGGGFFKITGYKTGGGYTSVKVDGPPTGYADGTEYNPKTGISLVGEEGPELRVIGQGDGILPADITKNLWGWGSVTPEQVLNNLQGEKYGDTTTVTIDKVVLPDVKNPDEFMEAIKTNFWRKTIQFQTKR